jgi:hypothetical protein
VRQQTAMNRADSSAVLATRKNISAGAFVSPRRGRAGLRLRQGDRQDRTCEIPGMWNFGRDKLST